MTVRQRQRCVNEDSSFFREIANFYPLHNRYFGRLLKIFVRLLTVGVCLVMLLHTDGSRIAYVCMKDIHIMRAWLSSMQAAGIIHRVSKTFAVLFFQQLGQKPAI